MKYELYRTQKINIFTKLWQFSGSLKMMLAKIKLQLCYQKFMNDNLPIILFHSFFFHKSC